MQFAVTLGLFDIPEHVDPVMRALPREIAEMAARFRDARWTEGWFKCQRDFAYADAYIAVLNPAVKPDGWKPPAEHVCKMTAECSQPYRDAALAYESAAAQRVFIAGEYEALCRKVDMVNGLAATERRGMGAG